MQVGTKMHQQAKIAGSGKGEYRHPENSEVDHLIVASLNFLGSRVLDGERQYAPPAPSVSLKHLPTAGQEFLCYSWRHHCLPQRLSHYDSSNSYARNGSVSSIFLLDNSGGCSGGLEGRAKPFRVKPFAGTLKSQGGSRILQLTAIWPLYP
ncbi:hypothetical protein I7I51_03656 [Histoplasma capsulatum]|uniref:Uncharacterized protein n=1 Tax=Ajellomyces capsulatus TaxID=5037 RepID=A0A8A1M674_AJECA|nr:hypothetical protein I7I51_03656 [Histoplasma capsulatum]